MNRRNFLKQASAFSLPAMLGGFQAAAFPSPLLASLVEESNKVLVLIDLNGGNDGLNTFVPLDAYENLHRARPGLVLPENVLLPMRDTMGMHPQMGGVRKLYEEGKMTLVQGVAYPNQNRSHFRSADIWNTAVDADQYATTGWLGRYLDDSFPNYPDNYPNGEHQDPFAITMGRSISNTCQGIHANFSMAIIDPNNIGGLSTGIEASLPNDAYGRELDFLVETFKKTNAYAERVEQAAGKGNSRVSYPGTNLAQQLKTVARLISGGLHTRVYVLKLGGFDTHAEQVQDGSPATGRHAKLLNTFANAIQAFQTDLQLLGLEDRVLSMTFSEFGRKIKANAGRGTDHGTAAPMMLFGSCLNAGVIGHNPEIAGYVDSNEGVAMQHDFRSVYGSVLMDWFGVEEPKVKALLTPEFQHIPLLGSCEAIAPGAGLAAKVYPNPFVGEVTLAFTLFERGTVGVQVFDVMGKVVRAYPSTEFGTGTHEVPLSMDGLSAGSYFARVHMGSQVKTLRMVKQ